jgi:MFS transporter, DHA1 family, tetracycline resistance protein
VPDGVGDPGPWPGFVAAILSFSATLMAIFVLPESLTTESKSASKKWIDMNAFKLALKTPVILLILATIFICVYSFANFETTLSMLLKGNESSERSPFHFSYRQVCMTFAFIGFTLMFIQGGVVRPASKRVSEPVLATLGSVLEIIGFILVAIAVWNQSVTWLFISLLVIVTGFSCLQPTLNSMLSRAASQTDQGAVLGLGQSVNALARIFGSAAGIPLLKIQAVVPYVSSAVLMLIGAGLIFQITRYLSFKK